MLQAYILVQTEVGKAAQVAKEVRSITGVTEAEDVTGPYDIIVRAEAKDVDELGRLVTARIQAVEGITRTLTCPSFTYRSNPDIGDVRSARLAECRFPPEAGV